MIKDTLSVTQNTLIVNQMTKNQMILRHLWRRLKIITDWLGEHNLWSAQDGRTLSEMWSPGLSENGRCTQQPGNTMLQNHITLLHFLLCSNVGMKICDIQITCLN